MSDFKPYWFGQYELIDLLGVGGMAEVFLARVRGAKGFEKILVIKRMLPKFSSDPRLVHMFVDEAKLTVQLQHANIVQILDFDEYQGQPFIVMEYVHGRDLFGVLRQAAKSGIKLPVDFGVHCITEMLKGLGYAHTATGSDGRPLNLLHRDVTPSNIFVAFSGEVKLGDFGIAHSAGSVDRHEMRGKFGYLAPEALRGQDLDVRADSFSAGVVLWETLAGRRLFVGRSKAETLVAIRDQQPEPPSHYNPLISPDLDTIALKSVNKDPDQRFQNAQDFEDALADYLFARRLRWSRRRIADVMHAHYPDESKALVLPPASPRPSLPSTGTSSEPDDEGSEGQRFVETVTQHDRVPSQLPQNGSGESSRWPESVDSQIVDVNDVNVILEQKKLERSAKQELIVHWQDGHSEALNIDLVIQKLTQAAQEIRGLGVIGEWQVGRKDLARLLRWDSLDRLPIPPRDPDAITSLTKISLARLLYELTLRRMSGLLLIRNSDGQQRQLYLRDGYPVYAFSDDPADGAPAQISAHKMLSSAVMFRGLVQVIGDGMSLEQALISVAGVDGRAHIERVFSAIIRSRLYSAFAWEKAQVEVYQGLESPLRPSFKLPHLLGILTRALRRYGQISGVQTLYWSWVPAIVPNKASHITALRLRDDEMSVVELIDGQRDLKTIMSQEPFKNPEAQKMAMAVLQVLVETGIVKSA